MRTTVFAAIIPAYLLAQPCQAQDHDFNGPRLGIEASYEDYGSGVDGEAVAAVAGWDFALGDAIVLGLEARYTIQSVDGSETTRLASGLLQTADVAIENNWGIGARIGYAVRDNLLLFGQGGYENLDVDAIRTVRSEVCAPPNGCVVSRNEFSFNDDMWTVGLGAEWAVTKNLRLRGQYTYGDSDSYDRNRFAISAAFQF